LPDSIVNELNHFVDSEDDIKLNTELDHSEYLVGKVTSELTFPQSLFLSNDNWRFFDGTVRAFVQAYDAWGDSIHADECGDLLYSKQREHLQPLIHSAWYVRSYAGDYNPVHTHPGVALASVGYLSLPDWDFEMNEDASDHAGRMAGCLQFSYGWADTFARNTYIVKPKVGDFYLFPAWLGHCVYPFHSNGERRSFAINFDLTTTPKVTNSPESE